MASSKAIGGTQRAAGPYRRASAVVAILAALLASAACSSGDGDTASGATSELNGVSAPTFESLGLRCKLINDNGLDDPTMNAAQYRANVRGTDLGIPVAHGDNLYFFFGDTSGSQGVWPLGAESLPDAVGYASLADVRNSPETLCSNLRFIVGPTASSVGHSIDERIQGDFSFAWMHPPPGADISSYIHNPVGPPGKNAFPNAPGDFEVPSGAFSYNGSIYLFYTTVDSPSNIEMKASYLARWAAPSPTTNPEYDILYSVDERFDDQGPLGGDFINIAPLVSGNYVYLYGTGKYRESAIALARKPLAKLSSPGGFERYDAKTKSWRYPARTGDPIVNSTGAGELSVRFFPAIHRFVMMNQEFQGGENVITVRFASKPEGPWTDGTRIASMSQPEFWSKFCCADNDCSGDRIMNCDRAGYYATYMLPDVTKRDGKFSIDFLVSTWDPYNVALMTATFDEVAAAHPPY